MSLVTRGLSTSFIVTAGLGIGVTLGQLYPNIHYYNYIWKTETINASYSYNNIEATFYVEKIIAILKTAESFIVIVDREDIENNRY